MSNKTNLMAFSLRPTSSILLALAPRSILAHRRRSPLDQFSLISYVSQSKSTSSKDNVMDNAVNTQRPDGQKRPTTDRQTRSSTRRAAESGQSSQQVMNKTGGERFEYPLESSVQHDSKLQKFTLDLGDNQVARIDYKPIGRNQIEMYHTEVPRELRGRGIGKLLAKGAFDCASGANLKLKVTCDYLEDYVSRFANEKHKSLVMK